jgi:hypothetical protein
MLVRHMLTGFVLGLLAVFWNVFQSWSFWSGLGLYALFSILGFLASAVASLYAYRARQQHARGRNSTRINEHIR